MIKKIANLFKELTCNHIYLPVKTLHNSTWVKSIYGYTLGVYQRIVTKEECVLCGKERIVEVEIPLDK
jgi:hypothetical protein